MISCNYDINIYDLFHSPKHLLRDKREESSRNYLAKLIKSSRVLKINHQNRITIWKMKQPRWSCSSLDKFLSLPAASCARINDRPAQRDTNLIYHLHIGWKRGWKQKVLGKVVSLQFVLKAFLLIVSLTFHPHATLSAAGMQVWLRTCMCTRCWQTFCTWDVPEVPALSCPTRRRM